MHCDWSFCLGMQKHHTLVSSCTMRGCAQASLNTTACPHIRSYLVCQLAVPSTALASLHAKIKLRYNVVRTKTVACGTLQKRHTLDLGIVVACTDGRAAHLACTKILQAVQNPLGSWVLRRLSTTSSMSHLLNRR